MRGRVYFGLQVYNWTKSGLDALGVTAADIDRPRPAVIATSGVSLFLVLLVFGIGIGRSFIEVSFFFCRY
jgi:hypothetical protein